jgi:hypothetical protein
LKKTQVIAAQFLLKVIAAAPSMLVLAFMMQLLAQM